QVAVRGKPPRPWRWVGRGRASPPPMSQAGNRRLTATPGGRFTAGMIRTGDEYRESIRDGRAVLIDGERVDDVTVHPAFKPAVDARARIYDLAHEAETRDALTYVDAATGETCAIGGKLPL